MLSTTLLAGALAFAAPAKALEPTVVGASLFKNGYAVVLRSVDIPASGEFFVGSPPLASLGTLWLMGSDGVRIQEATYLRRDKTEERPVASLDEILSENVGKQVELELVFSNPDSPRVIYGELKSVAGDILILEDEGGSTIAMRRGEVRNVRVYDGFDGTVTVSGQEPLIRVRAESPAGGKLYLFALQSGMTWSPAYEVDITDDKEAKVTAKATLLNDLAPLDGVELKLITGFANIAYQGQFDPFTSGQSIMEYLGYSGGMPGGLGGGGFSNQLMKADMAYGAAPAPAFESFEMSTAGGFQAEDLFFYRLPGVKLQPGERSYQILFQVRTPFRHLYTLDVPMRTDIGGYQVSAIPDPNATLQDVWHTVTFTNSGEQPLTTAPALLTQGGEILGQDTLNYTSAGAEASLRITKAMDVRADAVEEELERERSALTLRNGQVFDLVTLEGTIVIKNRKDKAVEMRIRKDLLGEVTQEGGGDARRTATSLNAVNPTSAIQWTPTVEAGGELTLTYRYRVYLPI